MNRISFLCAGLLCISHGTSARAPDIHQNMEVLAVAASQQEQPPAEGIKVDVEPTVLQTGTPKYPPEALRQGMEGTVKVKVWIGTNGEPRSAEVLQTDNPIFNETALAAAKEFRFTPARVNGKPVSVWVTIPFNYRISPGRKEKPSVRDSTAVSRELRAAIEALLEGKDSTRIMQIAAPEGLFVYRSREVTLQAAARNHSLQQIIPSRDERKIQSFHPSLSDDLHWASVVVRTGASPRNVTHVHSVVLTKDPSLGWRIRQWHVSD